MAKSNHSDEALQKKIAERFRMKQVFTLVTVLLTGTCLGACSFAVGTRQHQAAESVAVPAETWQGREQKRREADRRYDEAELQRAKRNAQDARDAEVQREQVQNEAAQRHYDEEDSAKAQAATEAAVRQAQIDEQHARLLSRRHAEPAAVGTFEWAAANNGQMPIGTCEPSKGRLVRLNIKIDDLGNASWSASSRSVGCWVFDDAEPTECDESGNGFIEQLGGKLRLVADQYKAASPVCGYAFPELKDSGIEISVARDQLSFVHDKQSLKLKRTKPESLPVSKAP